MRQFLSFERWPALALLELKLDIQILRSAARQRWVARRMNARFRRSLAWRKDLVQLLQNKTLVEELDVTPLADAPWLAEDAAATSDTGEDRSIVDSVRRYAAPSLDFEEVDSTIVGDRTKLAKVIAFYLPQFHAFPENDKWWGKGFTEWTNVARAIPRFDGHYQPRIPRDLGFYDLTDDHTMRRQIDLAKAAGLEGFCFYYYNFDGKRLLERPLERFLADPTLDMRFCIMWANENWTRRWDGAEAEVLMEQRHTGETTEQLVDDFARHMRDPRYITADGRPIVIIYRPNVIPDAAAVVKQWRTIFREKHGLNPILLMVQAFGSEDPAEYGFDGAIEFPPHKLHHRVVPANDEVRIYDPSMTGQIFRYRDFVAASLSFRAPDYPLIKTIFPSWDNEARRQGKGMSTTGSTPAAYGYWLEKTIRYARSNRAFGEPFVFINAWNEWAEGTYLEPDIHFGGAYLNETARRIVGVRPDDGKHRVLLVGHDAHPHGAQELLLNIGKTLAGEFGCEIEFMLCGGGPLLDRYREVAPTTVVSSDSVSAAVDAFSWRGFSSAIVNSVASGIAIEPLKSRAFSIVSLVHELPQLITRYGLVSDAVEIASRSDELVFPSAIVRDAFAALVGVPFNGVVRPQGLYKKLETSPTDRDDVRRELGLGAQAKIVFNAGFADMRKGIDIFADVASCFAGDPDVHFVWAGLVEEPTSETLGARLDLPNLHFVGQRDDMGRLLAAADVFALTSREDPFPSVVLEALAVGLPVVAFEGAGGFVDLFDGGQSGTLVPLADAAAMAAAIRHEFARSDEERATLATRRAESIARTFSFRDYAFWLLQRLDPDLLKVSVVVPNYNYERYIEGRLRSVFDQTYPIFEIIVLDDASSDDSVAAARTAADEARRRIRLVPNDVNSGNVFRQWRRGVELASGDLVWIAEADDLARPNFVTALAEKFVGADVTFAFSDSSTIDEDGKQLSTSYKFYYAKVDGSAFTSPMLIDGGEFASRFLSERNLILNASSVLWRRESLQQALEEPDPDVSDFTIAGDWLLYLRACRLPGKVGYFSRPLNIHRRGQGVTARTRGETQLREIQRIHDLYDRMFREFQVPEQRRRAYLDELREQFAIIA